MKVLGAFKDLLQYLLDRYLHRRYNIYIVAASSRHCNRLVAQDNVDAKYLPPGGVQQAVTDTSSQDKTNGIWKSSGTAQHALSRTKLKAILGAQRRNIEIHA